MITIDYSKLRAGDIIHTRDQTFLGRRIQRALGSWGNHDALVVWDHDRLAIGESVPPRAKITPLSEFERRLNTGRYALTFFRPVNATDDMGARAAIWWIHNIYRKPYDWGAYPRLLIKSLVGDWIKSAAGWEWAWYCTEGVAAAWLFGAGVDVFRKKNPTPKTTEKRMGDTLGEVADVVRDDPDRSVNHELLMLGGALA